MENYINAFYNSPYAFTNEKNILEDKDIGIVSNTASVMTPPRSVSELRCIQSCPYTNGAFELDLRIDGERVLAKEWIWLPNAILRRGEAENFSVESIAAVVPNSVTAVEKITVKNKMNKTLRAPLLLTYRGGPRREDNWGFHAPATERAPRDA